MCGPSCGDLDRPPSRQNMSLIAIIELVVMLCVGIVCGLDLVDLFDVNRWELWEILRAVRDALCVVGLVLIIIGLFFSISQYQIRSGILCFCIGAILSVVIMVFMLLDKNTYYSNKSKAYCIFYIVLNVFLAWILWRQSGHL